MTKATPLSYDLQGDVLQIVEITLNQGDCVIAESGALMYMEQGISLEHLTGRINGISHWVNRMVHTGMKLAMKKEEVVKYTNLDSKGRKIALCPKVPGKIVPIDLSKNESRICFRKEAFLCAPTDVVIDKWTKQVTLTEEDRLTLEQAEGAGVIFLHATGMIVEKRLEGHDSLRIEADCLVAMTTKVQMDLQSMGRKDSNNKPLRLLTLTGPGTIWLQALPFHRNEGMTLTDKEKNSM